MSEKVEILALWEKKGNNGTFYTGKIGNADVVAFKNTQKKNEKEPDLRIYVQKRVPREPQGGNAPPSDFGSFDKF